MSKKKSKSRNPVIEELGRLRPSIAEEYRPTKAERKSLIKTHTVHDYRGDTGTRYQLTHHLRPWARRSLRA